MGLGDQNQGGETVILLGDRVKHRWSNYVWIVYRIHEAGQVTLMRRARFGERVFGKMRFNRPEIYCQLATPDHLIHIENKNPKSVKRLHQGEVRNEI